MSQDKAQRPPTLSEVLPDLAARYVPISRWLPGYPKAWFRPDLTAAVTSWGVMVPVALAYAGLAGVPPELGLVTAFTAMAAANQRARRAGCSRSRTTRRPREDPDFLVLPRPDDPQVIGV